MIIVRLTIDNLYWCSGFGWDNLFSYCIREGKKWYWWTSDDIVCVFETEEDSDYLIPRLTEFMETHKMKGVIDVFDAKLIHSKELNRDDD